MDHIKDIFKGIHTEFGWFIWALVAIGVLWAWNGGLNEPTAHEGAYLKPPAPLDSGQVYGTYYAGTPTTKKETLNIPEAPATIIRETESKLASFLTNSKQALVVHERSLLEKSIYLDGVAGAKATSPSAEYVRIVSDPTGTTSVDISGMTLVGVSIPEGVSIPKAGNGDVVLAPGDRALITTGPSPVESSFQANLCSGYLNEFATFVPALRNDCPDGSDCRVNATKGFSYDACVAAHKNDKGFYTGEWRLFLGRPTEIWNDSDEIIKLLDRNGNIVDEIAY